MSCDLRLLHIGSCHPLLSLVIAECSIRRQLQLQNQTRTTETGNMRQWHTGQDETATHKFNTNRSGQLPQHDKTGTSKQPPHKLLCLQSHTNGGGGGRSALKASTAQHHQQTQQRRSRHTATKTIHIYCTDDNNAINTEHSIQAATQCCGRAQLPSAHLAVCQAIKLRQHELS
jgi:hypothetical protein